MEESILDYPGELSVIKDPYKREAWDGQSGRRHDDESRSQRDLKTLYFWF